MKKIILILLITSFFSFMKAEKMKTYTLQSTVDGIPLSVLIAEPDTTPVAILQLVHGMCEYKERYLPFISYLTSKGYLCVIHDHRGHGRSLYSDGDLGYFYEGGYQAMIDDTYQITQFVKDLYPNLKLYLFGHSMGSMVVRSYAKQFDNELNGLIICGSPSYNAASKIGEKVAINIARYKGNLFRSERLQRIAFLNYNKNFKDAISPNSWICSDPEVVARYDADKKCNFIFTANGFKNLFGLMNDAYDVTDWNVTNKHLPILFISGMDDPCLISEQKFLKAVDTMKKVGYTNVSYELYSHMRHEILNETGKEIVWNDINQILQQWNANGR